MSHEYTDPRASSTRAAEDEAAGFEFFGRWSRRKAAAARGTPEPDELETANADGGGADAALPEAEHEAEHEAAGEAPGGHNNGSRIDGDRGDDDRIDERTGKRFAELTDADMPDPETLDENSDIRMFMARNVSPALRMKALGRRFRHPKYNKVCICAEYADDYTNFEPLGNVVPHDLKTAIAREVEKLRDRLLGDGDEISREEAEARVLRERHQRQERYRAAVSERKRAAATPESETPEQGTPEAETSESEIAEQETPEPETASGNGAAAPAAGTGTGSEPQAPLAERNRAAPIPQDARTGTGEAS